MDGLSDPDVRRPAREGWPRRAVGALAAEQGFTLVEMVVALALAIVVVGGPLTLIVVSLKQQNATSSRTVAARQAEVGLERLTRDLRQAERTDSSGTSTPVAVTYGAGSSSASFEVPAPSGSTPPDHSVIWTCTAGVACTRKQDSGAAVPLIRGVASAAFTPIASDGTPLASGSPNSPAFVSIRVDIQATSQLDGGQTHVAAGVSNPITLRDGVDLRNYS